MSEPTRRFFKLFDGTMHESAHGDWVRYLDLTLATQRAEAAEAERDRLADDRARFPDRPDDIGRMIEARRGSLEDGIKSANAYARAAINRAEKAEAELDALRKHLLDLLAVVHGDGGHHTDAVGVRQSVVEAELAFHALRKDAARLDYLEKARTFEVSALLDRQFNLDHWLLTVFGADDDVIGQGKTLRAALDAALAVQPLTGGS